MPSAAQPAGKSIRAGNCGPAAVAPTSNDPARATTAVAQANRNIGTLLPLSAVSQRDPNASERARGVVAAAPRAQQEPRSQVRRRPFAAPYLRKDRACRPAHRHCPSRAPVRTRPRCIDSSSKGWDGALEGSGGGLMMSNSKPPRKAAKRGHEALAVAPRVVARGGDEQAEGTMTERAQRMAFLRPL